MKPINCLLKSRPAKDPTVARLKAVPQAACRAVMPTKAGIFASLEKSTLRSHGN